MRDKSMVNYAQLELASGVVVINASQFEQIKQALIAYLVQSRPEHYDIFISELRQGQSVLNAELSWQHGAWRLEERRGHLALTRYPERSRVMYFFVAFLKPEDDHWQVEAFEVERMWSK